jgi:hypothetical protein
MYSEDVPTLKYDTKRAAHDERSPKTTIGRSDAQIRNGIRVGKLSDATPAFSPAAPAGPPGWIAIS